MKPLKSTLALVALIFVVACGQSSQQAATGSNPPPAVAPGENVEQTLAKMEQDWVDAILKHDTAMVDQILADDFVTTLPDGRIQMKAQGIEDLKSGAFTAESMTINDVKVRVFGDTAVVTLGQSEKSQEKGKDMSGRTLWTDIFVKRNGKWQIVAEHGSCAAGGCGRG